MHPLFRIQNLSRLPLATRRVALAASSSPRDWSKILDICNSAHPDRPAHLLLPVVFASLDPKRIPDMTDVDRFNGPSPLADVFTMGLNAIYSLPLFTHCPLAVYQELWPRVWAWLEFLETYPDHVDRGEGVQPLAVCLFQSLEYFFRHDTLLPMVHTTPGIHAFIIRVWTLTPPSSPPSNIATLYSFLGCCSPVHSCLQKLLDGCGDDPRAIARLVVRHLDAALTAYRSYQSQSQSSDLSWRFATIQRIVGAMMDHGLHSSLLAAGLVTVYTVATAPLLPFRSLQLEAPVSSCADGLLMLLSHNVGSRYLPRALKAGLLQSLQAYVERPPPPNCGPSSSTLRAYLDTLLPRSMVYYSVVLAVASELIHQPVAPFPETSPAFRSWRTLIHLVQRRIEDLRHFQSSEYVHRRACDNLECRVIHRATAFKRCSGCHQQHYCSRSCQTIDWRHKGHRTACRRQAPPPDGNLLVRKRDESFLKLTVLRTYQRFKTAILTKQLAYMFIHGGDMSFCTEFDYSRACCVMSVRRAVVDSGVLGYSQMQVDAAAAPHSHLALHRVVIYNGSSKVSLPWVLRSDSSVLNDGLQRIWESLDRVKDAVEIERRLKSLSEAVVVETHG
ncbi:hypothetical protein C8R46DRAFT_1351301 [Mycena filopes]|nr:hypothetical protein C8R46DRAFT_1351301 [Mycena filopes]